MINPLSARISLPSTNVIPAAPASKRIGLSNLSMDSFTSSVNMNNGDEAKSNKTFLELLFGNVTKKNKISKAKNYNRFEAELYAKPQNKEELKQFIENYEAPIKW